MSVLAPEAPCNATKGRTVMMQFNNLTDVPDLLHDESERDGSDTVHMAITTKHDGDYRLSWNPKNPNMVAAAQIMFNEAVREGMEPHLVTSKKESAPSGETKTETRTKVSEFPSTLADGDEIVFLAIAQKVGG